MPWEACANEPADWLRWIECHIGLGTYLQTVGVVVAILGTALITWWSTTKSLEPAVQERKRRASILIYLLLPAVGDIVATAVRVKMAFAATNKGRMLAEANRLEEAVFYFRIDRKLPADVLQEMHVLEPGLAETIAQLYYYLDRYNNFIELNVPGIGLFDEAGYKKFEETFETLFVAVENLAAKALAALQAARSSA